MTFRDEKEKMPLSKSALTDLFRGIPKSELTRII